MATLHEHEVTDETMALAAQMQRLPARKNGWRNEAFHIDITDHLPQIRALAALQAKTHGNPDPAVIGSIDVARNSTLIKPTMVQKDVAKITVHSTILRDICEWQWHSPGHISFRPLQVAYPLQNASADQFQRLIHTVATNFPSILLRPHTTNRLQLRHSATDTIDLRPQGSVFVLHRIQYATGYESTHTVRWDSGLRRLSKLWYDDPHAIGTHPALHGHPPLFASVARMPTITRRFMHKLQQKQRQAGPHALAVRNAQLRLVGPTAADAIPTLHTRRIHGPSEIAAQDVQLWTRIKSGALRNWNAINGDQVCGAAACPANMQHQPLNKLWNCSLAQAERTSLRKEWASVGGCTTAADFQKASHGSARLHWDQPDVRSKCAYDPDGQTHKHMTDTIGKLWVADVARTMIGLWREGTALQRGEPHLRHLRWIRASADDTRAAIYYTCPDPAILAALLQVLQHTAPLVASQEPSRPASNHTWILFFDGGSRGNPGVAGCGSILLRYNISAGTHEAVWMTAHFLGLPSTNNQAEYTALLLGLQAAARLQACPLQVVGDSLMIIRQHRANHAPINKHLAGLFQRTKRTTDPLGVYQWHHHYRCHNKIADHAANVAMDLQAHRSWPSTEHFELDGVLQHADMDVSAWEAKRRQLRRRSERPPPPSSHAE